MTALTDLTVGDTATIEYTLTRDNTPIDATVTVTVTAPDGTTSTPTPTHVSTGVWYTDAPVDQAGIWSYLWEATGAATDTEDGTFSVREVGQTSDIRKVRLLINDLDPTALVFTDPDIEVFLALEGDSIKLAAAQALDTIASNESLVKQRIRTLDLQTDGPAVAKDLREHAARLRSSVGDEDSGLFEFTTGMGTPELVEHATSWPY